MKRSLQTALPTLAFLLFVTAPMFAGAEGTSEPLVDASDPQRLVELIQDMGYRAQLDKDEVGDPLITSSVGGTKFAIIFYGCDKDTNKDCDFLLYKVGYDLDREMTLESINEWNATQLVGRAYRDDVKDPWLEMAWNVKGGVSVANFQSTFEWWELSVGAFEDHIGF